MVLALIYNEEDPVEITLYQSAIRSINDINKSIENLTPKIEVFNLTYKGDIQIQNQKSLFLKEFENLVQAHGVKTFFGLSSNEKDIRTLIQAGNFSKL
jgi:hypothetical protein